MFIIHTDFVFDMRELLLLIITGGVLTLLLLSVRTSNASMSRSPAQKPALSSRLRAVQQTLWQQKKWQSATQNTAASHDSASMSSTVPRAFALREQTLDEPQAPEARRAVEIALSQPIPPKGDGRRGGFDDQRNVKRESDTVRRMLAQDGLHEWRPDPTCFPPQRRPGATMAELLSAVPVGTSTTASGTAWLAFGNAGATEMLMNWVHHVCKLGMGARTVIAAYDAELLATLRGLRIPAYNYTGALPQIHFRGTPFLFHRMGYLKAMTIREVLLTGRHVLVSDSDVAWVRDPLPELEALAAAGASLAPATDCLHIEADRDKSERPNAPYLCGHQPGSRSGAVFNTGIIFLAATNATVHFCERWAEATLHLPAEQWWSDDQGVFNKLLTGHGTWPFAATGFYPVRAAGLGGRLVHGPFGLKMAPLPVERYCSGHLVWVQQEALPLGCNAVHATFTEFGDAGKRWRFMEAGLWGALPASYYTDGHFLTFEPPRPPADPAPCGPTEGRYVVGAEPPRPCGGEDPELRLPRPKRYGDVPADEGIARSSRLRLHIELMRRQLHALRDALALAFLLNRTLVLPHMECMCDRSELVDYIPYCVFPGAPANLTFPRKCSTHFILNIHKLLYLHEPFAYGFPRTQPRALDPRIRLRAHAFLSDPRTDADILRSSATVRVSGPPVPLEARPRCSAPHERDCRPALVDAAARERELAKSDAEWQQEHDELRMGDRDRASELIKGASLPHPPVVVELPRGATDERLLSSLGTPEMRRTRLLRLSDAEGLFGGWHAQLDKGALFNQLEGWFLLGGDFCCTSRHDNEGRLYPNDPPRLSVGRERPGLFG